MKRAIAIAAEYPKGQLSDSNGLSFWLLKIAVWFISALKSCLYGLLGFGVLIGAWYLVCLITEGEMPTPLATFAVFWELVKDPVYDYGPNDKGIAIQLFSSLGRVFTGFVLGALVAIPIGILMGANSLCQKIFYPIVQILKPVSPLAWFPLGLVAFESASKATVFIIFITSLWPTLINTAFGVTSLPDDRSTVTCQCFFACLHTRFETHGVVYLLPEFLIQFNQKIVSEFLR